MMNKRVNLSSEVTINSVDDYHQRTKHSLQKYAAGPDGLDWDTQPNPYRSFEGCPSFSLPLPAKNLIVDFNTLFQPGEIKPAKLEQKSLGAFLELSLGLSSWKVFGTDRWALRVNPSSGNLHPTEAYLAFAGFGMFPSGLYHYHSYKHSIEHRCHYKDKPEILQAIGDQQFIIGLSSIHWREAWKYGERAYRYCQLDTGHVIGSIRYAAALLGWKVKLLPQFSDEQIASLLGLDRNDFENVEQEVPELLLLVSCDENAQQVDSEKLLALASKGEWKGKANCLSPDNRINWSVIEQISNVCKTPASETLANKITTWLPDKQPSLTLSDTDNDASSIIRHRRSAQAFDAQTVMPLTRFYRILDSLICREDTPPFDSITWKPRVHMVIYVHRVEGLKPGLYAFPRHEDALPLMKETLRKEFTWTRPPICPDSLPLYNLISANSKNAARTLSCHQAIAADGAFCVSMLAEYEDTVHESPWLYKQLFWEAGLAGQNLYIEAEAAEARATGIGCFFDDAVHETLGISSPRLQVIYNFTVGTPVLDTRLITLPPYGHLNDDKK